MKRFFFALALIGGLTLAAPNGLQADPPTLYMDCVTQEGELVDVLVGPASAMEQAMPLCLLIGGHHIKNIRFVE